MNDCNGDWFLASRIVRTRAMLTVAIIVLGGSWVVPSRVIRPLIWVIIIVTLPLAPLITTHEPPSSDWPRV